MFLHLTGLPRTGRKSLSGVISEGRCCDLGNLSRTGLWGKRLSGPVLEKARSGLVPVFQCPEWKLAESLDFIGGQDC